MLMGIVCGLSEIATSLAQEALDASYGVGSVVLKSIPSSSIKLESHKALKDTSIILISFDRESESLADQEILSTDRYLPYTGNDQAFAASLSDSFGVQVSIPDISSDVPEQVELVSPEISSLKDQLQTKDMIISNLQARLESLLDNSSIDSLTAELSSARERINELESLPPYRGISSSDFDELQLRYDELDRVRRDLDYKNSSLRSQLEAHQNLISQYQEDKKASENDLQKEILELKAKLSNTSELNSQYKSLEEENTTLQTRLRESAETIADLVRKSGDGSDTALDNVLANRVGAFDSHPHLDIDRSSHSTIWGILQGSDGSAKETARQAIKVAHDISTNNPTSNVLILDLSPHSPIDYVLDVPFAESCAPWLVNGGSFSEYLSGIPNTLIKIASLGTFHFNEAVMLLIDWSARLSEIRTMGYLLVIIGGNISSFSGNFIATNLLTPSDEVYVVSTGLLTSLRTLIISLQGINLNPELVISKVNADSSQYLTYLKNSYTVIQS